MGLAPDNSLVLRDMDQAAPNDISDQRWITRDHVDAYEVRKGGVVHSVWKPFGAYCKRPNVRSLAARKDPQGWMGMRVIQ